MTITCIPCHQTIDQPMDHERLLLKGTPYGLNLICMVPWHVLPSLIVRKRFRFQETEMVLDLGPARPWMPHLASKRPAHLLAAHPSPSLCDASRTGPTNQSGFAFRTFATGLC